MKSTMEITIWSTIGMGKCISKLIYWWDIIYQKGKSNENALKNTVVYTVVRHWTSTKKF